MNSTVAIERGLTLCNAFNKETFIFSGPLDDPTVGRFDVRLEPGGSGEGNGLVQARTHILALRFLSMGNVKGFLESADYAPYRAARTAASESNFFAFENEPDAPQFKRA
jgi:hypothetical protein